MAGIKRPMIDSHLGICFKTAQVASMVAKILTTPDGILRRALCFESYPKLWIKTAEKVLITPLGIVIQAVSNTNSHVCVSESTSLRRRRSNPAGLVPGLSLPSRSLTNFFSS
jgi:hypothetical protein